MKIETTLYSKHEMGTKIRSFLEGADDEDIIIFYEQFCGECTKKEFGEEEFDRMFHSIEDVLSHDYDNGELQKLVYAMHLAFGIRFNRTYEVDGEFVYEFNGKAEE